MKNKISLGFFLIVLFLICGIQKVQSSDIHQQKNSEVSVVKSKLQGTNFNDGITDWKETSQNTIEKKEIGDNQYICYTFGNADGKLKQGLLPKMNTFILDKGKIVGSSYMVNDGLASSYDFGMVDKETADDYIYDLDRTSISKKISNYKFYEGTTADGEKALKVVGSYASIYDMELVLRPDGDSTIIRQELYFVSKDSFPEYWGIFFAKDTALNGNDSIPIFAQKNNSGLYMHDDNYKLIMNMKVKDGPSNYAVMDYHRSGNYDRSDYAFKKYNPRDFSGTGLETKNLPEDYQVYSGNDSSYSCKWPFTTYRQNVVYHYRCDIGVTIAKLVVPTGNEDYENKTSSDGKNHVGDTILFHLKARNLGYKSNWSKLSISDVIPEGLEVDSSSIELVNNDGQKKSIPESAYNSVTRTLNVKTDDLADNKEATVNVSARILGSAGSKTLTNKMVAAGTDINNTKIPIQTAKASVDVPVEKYNYADQITKLVKNDSSQESDYQTGTNAINGDKVSYKIHYGVDGKSPSNLATGELIDNLPTSLKLDGQATIKYSDGTTQTLPDLKSIKLNTMKPSQSADITFSAHVASDKIETIINKVKVTGQSSTKDQIYNVSQANLNVVDPAAKVTHELKNETKLDKDFGESTEGSKDDIITYRFTVDNLSGTQKQPYLEKITDQTNNFELVKDSIHVSYTTKEGLTTNWDVDQAGQDEFKTKHSIQLSHGNTIAGEVGGKFVVTYKMKVTTADLKKVIVNNARYNANSGVVVPARSNDTKLTTKLGVGTVTFRYIDRKTGEPIGEKEILVTGPINKKVSELSTNETSDHQEPNKIRPAYIKDYVAVDYTENPDLSQATFYQPKDIDPVIDLKPQIYTIRYERSGLNFSAPKQFDFGEYLAHESEATYYLKALKNNQNIKIPYGITITDYYGVRDWMLGVQQDKQFSAKVDIDQGKTKLVQLDQAQLQFENAKFDQVTTNNENTTIDQVDVLKRFNLIPGDSVKTLVTYHKKGHYAAGIGDNTKNQIYDNPGFSNYSYHFGDQRDADYSIGLHVPLTTKRYKTRYTTQLTWSLTVAP